MYIPLNSKSKSLAGLSDLTVLAPIRQGLVPSLDSITYRSRLRRLMEVLQLLRRASHEYAPFRPISDSAERVGRIHSFRVAIVEPNQLLLAVTFDGAREAYIRVLWQKIGTLLDLLFCNTEGHVPAYGRSLADWDAWIDGIQVKTDFFYGRPRLTADDVQFLRDEEQLRRSPTPAAEADSASVQRSEPTAEMRAWSLANNATLSALSETSRQGVQTIALLHRLTAWFIPGTPDGDFLHRAARDLLPEFLELIEKTRLLDPALSIARERFADAIDWFRRPFEPREVPAPPIASPGDAIKDAIQGGILEPYAQVTHGALLLMAFRPGADARSFWAAMRQRCVSAKYQPTDGRAVWNVALTHEGLRAAGMTESELSEFPLEFRQGMEARNGVLGDLWINHPDRWRRPLHLRTGEPVEMGAVHVVVQLRCGQASGMAAATRFYDLQDRKHPLHVEITEMCNGFGDCMDLLAIQPMVRHLQNPKDPNSPAVEHFGYADGNGQPELDPTKAGPVYTDNLVHPGEFLVGLANAADPAAGEGAPEVSDWLLNGSFLVLRKLSQDVTMFRDLLAQGATGSGLSPQLLAGKMVGRMPDGDPLAAPGAGNDFNYDLDPLGSRCPFHAHIRRANPRLSAGTERPMPAGGLPLPHLPPGARLPRIMRRGMSFGAPLATSATSAAKPAADDAQPPRGICFMAYNASIGEQFEIIQRWLAGGNSTGGFSGRSDPLIGVAAAGERRTYVFEQADANGNLQVHRLVLDGNDDPTALPDPLVRLEWGVYLFTPSLAALKAFEDRAAESAGGRARAEWPWSADRGRAAIERLQSMDSKECDRVAAWKAALEDPEAQKDYSAASIWAAIRRDFGGVLRTPYGVLAASHAHAQAVLSDPGRRYSVEGYRERSAPTLGDMYLGLDDLGPGCPYRARSTAPNQAIRLISEQQAFDAARALTRESLRKLIAREQENARDTGDPVWRLQFGADEVWDEVLEGLCQLWFGLPDVGPWMVPGRFRWDWQPGIAIPYPGHFLSPSRYIFQPQPGSEVARIGSLHGTAVNAAFRTWVSSVRDQGQLPKDPGGNPAALAKAFFEAFPRPPGGTPQEYAAQDERVAVTLLGALIGFLPTVEGNLRQSLNEWLLDGTFWSLRAGLQTGTAPKEDDLATIRAALQRSMMLRPSPEVVWRRATCEHALGPVTVRTAETVVVAIVSATHEQLEQRKTDEGMVFGGWREIWPPGTTAPTHACPGHSAAMGTLLGIVSGLLECKEALRPTPFPLSFRMEGQMPPPAATLELPVALRGLVSKSHPLLTGPTSLGALAAATLRILSGGDSWFDYAFGSDLIKQLKERGDVEVTNQGSAGTRLDAFAGKPEVPGKRDDSGAGRLCTTFVQLAANGQAPGAILVSVGGNDVVGDVLKTYIKDISQQNLTPSQIKALIAADDELDDTALKNLMDGPSGTMRTQVLLILDKLKAHCRRADGSPVPVVWQAYDHPIPDGRIPAWPLSHNKYSVLWKPLSDLGYTDLADTATIMKKVVDRYNDMLLDLSTGAYKGQLIHADLRGTLNGTLADDAYRNDWANELHATTPGFQTLAQKLYTNYLSRLVPVPAMAATAAAPAAGSKRARKAAA